MSIETLKEISFSEAVELAETISNERILEILVEIKENAAEKELAEMEKIMAGHLKLGELEISDWKWLSPEQFTWASRSLSEKEMDWLKERIESRKDNVSRWRAEIKARLELLRGLRKELEEMENDKEETLEEVRKELRSEEAILDVIED